TATQYYHLTSAEYTVLQAGVNLDGLNIVNQSMQFTNDNFSSQYFAQTDRYTDANFTSDESYALTPHTNRSDTDITDLIDLDGLNTVNQTMQFNNDNYSARYLENTSVLISNSTNISCSYVDNKWTCFFNASCESITGSSALCDGGDAVGTGDPEALNTINQSMQFTNTNFTVQYYGITSRYNLANHSAETHTYIGNCSGTDCTIGWGNLTSVPAGFADGIDNTAGDLDGLNIVNQSMQYTDANFTSDESYALTPHTNLSTDGLYTDANFTAAESYA
ncbi:unnamed protein product, partial [marine sediment metagenome]